MHIPYTIRQHWLGEECANRRISAWNPSLGSLPKSKLITTHGLTIQVL